MSVEAIKDWVSGSFFSRMGFTGLMELLAIQ
jgi:hypothetical protein